MTLSVVESSSEREEALQWPPAACPHFVARWREPELPFWKVRSGDPGLAWGRLGCILSGERWEGIVAVSRQMEVTPAEFLLGAWRAVLARVRAGKGETCDLSLNFEQFVASVADGTCKVSVRSDEPASSFEFYLQEGEPGALSTEVQESEENCTVRLLAFQNPTHLELLLLYEERCFDREDMQRLFNAFALFLDAAVTAPAAPVDEINFLSESEAKRLLVDFNQTQAAFPKEKCLQTLLEEQAQRYSARRAIGAGDQWLSYRDLDRRAQALAEELLRRGLAPETPVPLFIEPSAEGLVGFFGILKARGICVPVDPRQGGGAAAFYEICESSPAIVTLSGWNDHLEALAHKTLPIDRLYLQGSVEHDPHDDGSTRDGTNTGASVPAPRRGAHPCRGAVILRGSGERPSFVLLTHRNLVNAACARVLTYSDHVRTCLLDAQLGWGALLGGIVWTFLQGGTAVLAPEGVPTALISLLEKHQPSHMVVPAHSWEDLLARTAERAFTSVDGVVLVSPTFKGENMGKRSFPSADIWTEWGTPETTFSSCFRRLNPEGVDTGNRAWRPFPNVELYVLDPHDKLLPIWATGQVCVGGECVGHKFKGGQSGTAEFIANPFGRPTAEHLYASGVSGHWRPNGTLEIEFAPG